MVRSTLFRGGVWRNQGSKVIIWDNQSLLIFSHISNYYIDAAGAFLGRESLFLWFYLIVIRFCARLVVGPVVFMHLFSGLCFWSIFRILFWFCGQDFCFFGMIIRVRNCVSFSDHGSNAKPHQCLDFRFVFVFFVFTCSSWRVLRAPSLRHAEGAPSRSFTFQFSKFRFKT